MADDQDITSAILLQHMQAMRFDLTEQMRRMEQRLQKQIVAVRTDLIGEIKMNRVEILGVKRDLARVEGNLSMQIGNIDIRLDDLEVVQVPVLKKAVGIGK